MKKNFLFTLSAAGAALCLCCFAACGDDSGTQNEGEQPAPPAQHLYHTWETTWKSDDSRHWHKCEECDEKTDYEPHAFVNHVCECGKIDPYSALYTFVDDNHEYVTVDSLISCYENTLTFPAAYNGIPVTAIDEYAFLNSAAFTKAILPESVKTIGNRAFGGCASLTEISLPASLTELGENIFDGCTALTSVTFTGTQAQWNALAQNSEGWNGGSSLVKVVCSDGEITL